MNVKISSLFAYEKLEKKISSLLASENPNDMILNPYEKLSKCHY